jgi:hypothetical protein
MDSNSVIKRSVVIQNYMAQMKEKPLKIRRLLDDPFDQILDRIHKRKPTDIKCHITDDNKLSFNVEFKPNQKMFIEYRLDQTPNTLVTIDNEGTNGFDAKNDIYLEQLENALDLIDETKI